MGTDEKDEKKQEWELENDLEKDPEKKPAKKLEISGRKIKKFASIAAFVIFMLMIIWIPPSNMRSDVKRMVEDSESEKLCDIAKKRHYRALPVLEDTVGYVLRLESEKSFISENESLRKEMQALTTRLDLLEQRMDMPIPVSETPDPEQTPLCRLFTGEVDGNKGETHTEDRDDTMTYMTYARESRAGEPWEQYDRLEVDMYKRSGQWKYGDEQEITAILPDKIAGGSYRICIFLRTDVTRNTDWRQESSGNGGRVTLSVGDQIVSSGALAQARMGKAKGEDEIVSIRGGEEIQLRIVPEEGNDFFSFAICINRETQSAGGGMSRD